MFEPGKESKIIVEKELETMYSWLPAFCRSTDPKVIYSVAEDGRSYKSMMTSLFEHSGLPSILLIEAGNGAIFGAFFDH